MTPKVDMLICRNKFDVPHIQYLISHISFILPKLLPIFYFHHHTGRFQNILVYLPPCVFQAIFRKCSTDACVRPKNLRLNDG